VYSITINTSTKEKTMEKFAATVKLAKSLNEARLLANSIDSAGIQGQHGAYGHIANALRETLAHLVGRSNVEDAYGALLDGCSIDEILG
jgi:hypothetical protein